jgi:Ca-activated chloride channel family protein
MRQKRLALETIVCMLLIGGLLLRQSPGAEDPDALYREGRFAEAEKAYADADMDHPKEIRYRYNRGCAAFQKGDYESARAAFSSVLIRTDDDEMRFRASYNLGNTAFKQEDLESAVSHYKKALSYKPENEDARHNLELAVRKLAALEEQRKDQSQQGPQERKEKEDQSIQDQQGQEGKKSSKEVPEGEKGAEEPTHEGNQIDGKDQGESQQEEASGEETKTGGERPQRTTEAGFQDLSGELESLRGLPEKVEDGRRQTPSASVMDKNKAEALLDNVEEDRSRFLRFQVPKEKKYGVPSGKDW